MLLQEMAARITACLKLAGTALILAWSLSVLAFAEMDSKSQQRIAMTETWEDASQIAVDLVQAILVQEEIQTQLILVSKFAEIRFLQQVSSVRMLKLAGL